MAEFETSSNAAQPSNSNSEPPKLSELLERGWKTLEEVDNTEQPLGSNSVQVRVKRAISGLEEASRMVAQLDLFSRNEELDEIATSELKYLLVPCLLGALTMKQTSRDKRLEIVQTARAYFLDYLMRCKDRDISQFQMPTTSDGCEAGGTQSKALFPPCQSNLVAMAAQRQAKIERYRQKKELETRLASVKMSVDSGQADDETSREFYLLHLRRWVTVSLEEVESIDQELVILKNMDVLKSEDARPAPQPTRAPFKPFILTKDAVQAQVFGAGYPSLPTMTVDDWYEQHRQRGVLPDQGVPKRVPVEEDRDAKELEEEEKERLAERDDEESLHKARGWDDYKDTHRRGYGNRHNMG